MQNPTLLTAAALLLALSVVTTAHAEKLVLPVSLDGIERDKHQAKATEPRSARTEAELSKLLGKAAAVKFKGRVDFATHDFVLFQWAGSGQDKITAAVKDGTAIFQYSRGLTRDLRQHRLGFAVKKGVKWKVETLPAADRKPQPSNDNATPAEIHAPDAKREAAIPWRDFSPAILKELRDKNKPVLVFIYAAWDTNCELLDRTLFKSRRVVEAIKQREYIPLRADCTNRPADEDLKSFLRQVGWDGNATIVVFSGAKNKEPVVLQPNRARKNISAEDLLDAMEILPHHRSDGKQAKMQSYAVFKKGQSAGVRLVYPGGIKNWDARCAMDDGKLWIVNNATLMLTDDNGNVIAPREGKVVTAARNMVLDAPFDLIVDLSKVYDISKAGKYTVEWGCNGIKTQEIRIQIVD